MKELSPLEIDALTEIINIGVGRAASSLNDIIGAHIQLKVPRIELFPLEKLSELLLRLGHSNVSTVIQAFHGEFTGSAALLFPPESTQRLLSALTGTTVKPANLDAESRSTLMEIGNIVINCILGTMANILECSMDFTLPRYQKIKNIVDLLTGTGLNENEAGFIILAEANFYIKSLEVTGYIFIFFKIDSFEILTRMINRAASR
jgi:chemotaxis protein CheC